MTDDDFSARALKHGGIGALAGVLAGAGLAKCYGAVGIEEYVKPILSLGAAGFLIGAVPQLVVREMIYLSARAQGYKGS